MSKALCNDIIGTVWVTGANASLMLSPTRWVIESGVTNSGLACSSATSSW